MALHCSSLSTQFRAVIEVYSDVDEFVCVVISSAEGGELYRHIDDRENGFSERDVKQLMRQTLEGLAFLHERSIVHMDIKVKRLPCLKYIPLDNIIMYKNRKALFSSNLCVFCA